MWAIFVTLLCYDFPYFVLLVNTLTYYSYPSRSLLSQWTFSHHIWHICLLILTFIPCFIFQTLCPDYLTNPIFLYKYQTQFPVQTTCSYLSNSNKYIVYPLFTSPIVHCKDFLGKIPSLALGLKPRPWPWTLRWVSIRPTGIIRDPEPRPPTDSCYSQGLTLRLIVKA